MIYLTPNPRVSTASSYELSRSHGTALRVPVRVPTSTFLKRVDVGTMLTPAGGNRSGALQRWQCQWAADTGNYTRPVSVDTYLDWLRVLTPFAARCLFATAPDVVGNAAATWEMSAPVLSRIRALGYPAALVAQDGLERLSVPWSAFDVLFLGGSTAWKLGESSYALSREAKQRGKWLHMGRVNSGRRLKIAQLYGCDSADGTSLAFNPALYVRDIPRWLDAVHLQPLLLPNNTETCLVAEE